MLELPEITTLCRQLTSSVAGRTIKQVTVLSSPHKFAFLNRSAEDYPRLLVGRTLNEFHACGNYAIMNLDNDLSLVLGDMGGRLLYHPAGEDLPQKHQLLLQFEDQTSLTLTLQMWGAILLLEPAQLASHSRLSHLSPAPLDDAFTLEHFQQR